MGHHTIDNDAIASADKLGFTPPLHVHHLTGGLALLLGSNRLAAVLSPGASNLVLFSLMKRVGISAALQSQPGIRILGRNTFHHVDEMHDPVTTNFIIRATATQGDQCLAHTQTHRWSGLANALHQLQRDSDAMLAKRVSSQMRLCLSRIERLSLAYRTVLSIVCANTPPPNHKFIGDKYAQHLGSEYRSVLNELYSLRDAVLAASFRLHHKRTESFQISKLKALIINQTDGSSRMIADAMFSEDGDQLIHNMSLYRAVAQHCLGATNPVVGDVYQLVRSTGTIGIHPYLVYPLYDNIERMRAIEQGSSKGVLERLPLEEIKRFAGLPAYQDALEFCYDCFERLLKIAEVLEREIGIEPRILQITDDDILEMTFTDKTGKTIRAKRDESGNLLDY